MLLTVLERSGWRSLPRQGSLHSIRKNREGINPPKKGATVHLKELFSSWKEQFLETQAELYGKQEIIRYYSIELPYGAKAVLRVSFCPSGNERNPEYSGKHQPGTGTTFHHPPVQLPLPDRMYFPTAGSASRGILLSFLVRTYAKTELLPKNRRAQSPGAGGG